MKLVKRWKTDVTIEFNVFRFFSLKRSFLLLYFFISLLTSNMRYTRACFGVTLVVRLVFIYYCPTRSDAMVERGFLFFFFCFFHIIS